MLTELFSIQGPWPGKLAIAGRPRGGGWLPEELRNWKEAGVEAIVSLLTQDEENELKLYNERSEAMAGGLRYECYRITEGDVPASAIDFRSMLEPVLADLQSGHSIVVHSRHGIGRAGLFAVGLLASAGIGYEEAVQIVVTGRGGVPVPETRAQKEWLQEYVAGLRD